MAATNRPDVLDPALTRPGRFDRRIIVDNPDHKGRLEISTCTSRASRWMVMSISNAIKQTAGFSGADLANLVNEAACWPHAATRTRSQLRVRRISRACRRRTGASQPHHSAAREVHLGLSRSRSRLLGKLLPNADPPHKVTILPRGMALGYTLTLPSEDRFLMSKSQMLDEMTVFLGGRVASSWSSTK
jgi:cell division protease FtsH